MRKSFKNNIIRLLGIIALYVVMALSVTQSAFAASSIDKTKTGSISIRPQYNSSTVMRGTFAIYKVALLNADSTTLNYTLQGVFAGAEADYGLDISSVKTAEQQQSAASTLAGYTAGATPHTTLNIASGSTALNLELGAYLVVQTAATGYYTVSAPFIVFVPAIDSAQDEWVYAITAYPKLGYDAPATTTPPPSPSESEPTVSRPPEESETPSESPTESATVSPSESQSQSPSLTPSPDSSESPAESPPLETIRRPGTPDVYPEPARAGSTLVEWEDGILIEISEEGVPLGYWVYEPEEEVWIFEPEIPLGYAPATGDSSNLTLALILLFASFFALVCVFVVKMTVKDTDA